MAPTTTALSSATAPTSSSRRVRPSSTVLDEVIDSIVNKHPRKVVPNRSGGA